MRRSIKILGTLALLAMSLILGVTPAAAQANSNVGNIVINANLPEAITITVNNSPVSIPLAANTATNNSSNPQATVKVAWVLGPTRTALKVFINATGVNALNNGTDNIPAANVKISTDGGVTFTALNAATPFGANGAQEGATIAIGAGPPNTRAGSRTDTVNFQIDTTFNPTLSAGLYTGTLNVQAQATP